MNLTPLGAQVAQQGPPERRTVGQSLISLVPPKPITAYVNNGICYDTVAYVRFLLGANIAPNDLLNVNGQLWAPRFNAGGMLWHGAGITAGTAVLFRRPGTNQPFHVAISLGGLKVRGVNGNNLGAGWTPVGDCNLSTQLTCVPPGQYNNLKCGPGPGDVCNVWLSSL